MKKIIFAITLMVASTVSNAGDFIETIKKDGWQRIVKHDDMRNNDNVMNTLASSDTNFPERVLLVASFDGKKNMIYFINASDETISNNCHNGCKVSFRFDNNKIIETLFLATATNVIAYIGKNDEKGTKFIDMLKNSNQLVIELPYENRNRQVKFKTTGLKL